MIDSSLLDVMKNGLGALNSHLAQEDLQETTQRFYQAEQLILLLREQHAPGAPIYPSPQ